MHMRESQTFKIKQKKATYGCITLVGFSKWTSEKVKVSEVNSVIANQGYVTSNVSIEGEFSLLVLIFRTIIQINHLKIIQCDFVGFFFLSQ